MHGVERFAAEASEFCEWASHGTDTGAEAARNALLRVTRLYLAALELPQAEAGDTAHEPDARHVENDEWRTVFDAACRLPVDTYGQIFDPLTVPPEEPVVGSVSDDIADIYRDVMYGLRMYESGQHAAAVWEWTFGLQSHWGEHATGSIRTLHCWLAENAPDRLVSTA